jgi:hypothetical protein
MVDNNKGWGVQNDQFSHKSYFQKVKPEAATRTER